MKNSSKIILIFCPLCLWGFFLSSLTAANEKWSLITDLSFQQNLPSPHNQTLSNSYRLGFSPQYQLSSKGRLSAVVETITQDANGQRKSSLNNILLGVSQKIASSSQEFFAVTAMGKISFPPGQSARLENSFTFGTALSFSTSFNFEKINDQLPLQLNYSQQVGRSFHTYRTTRSGRDNSMISWIQNIRIHYRPLFLSEKLTLSAGFIFSRSWNYDHRELGETYSFNQNMNYQFPIFDLILSYESGGAAFGPSGIERKIHPTKGENRAFSLTLSKLW